MVSAARKFQEQLGSQLVEQLGGGFRFYKSTLQLRRKSGAGEDVLVISGSNKHSPWISLAFYFGRNFTAAKRIEKLIKTNPAYYHIFQYSLNRNGMKELDYSGPFEWTVNIEEPYDWLIPELMQAIQGMAFPFFERFHGIEVARNAIAHNDSWCIGHWWHLLYLDAAMGDWLHFENWKKESYFANAPELDSALSVIKKALAHEV